MASLHLEVMDTCDVTNEVLCCQDQSQVEPKVNRETISKISTFNAFQSQCFYSQYLSSIYGFSKSGSMKVKCHPTSWTCVVFALITITFSGSNISETFDLLSLLKHSIKTHTNVPAIPKLISGFKFGISQVGNLYLSNNSLQPSLSLSPKQYSVPT